MMSVLSDHTITKSEHVGNDMGVQIKMNQLSDICQWHSIKWDAKILGNFYLFIRAIDENAFNETVQLQTGLVLIETFNYYHKLIS